MRIISRIVNWAATPYTIYLILKDPTNSRSVKLRAVIVLVLILAYVVSPIDIISDVIPLSGWIDDLIIVPLGLTLVRKITPCVEVIEKKRRAQASVRRVLLWTIISFTVAILIGLLWIGFLIYIIVRLIAE